MARTTTQVNGYIILEALTKLRPPEEDYTIEGIGSFRVRGLTSGEIQRIITLARNTALPGGTDEEVDRDVTVALGLVQPSLGSDLEAARIIVGGMTPMLRMALCGKIRQLTWGWMTPAEPPEAAAGDQVAQSDRPAADGAGEPIASEV
ncbi:MAG: hypothetical protein AB7R89_06235 [Dehalococcoidia bacterium]